MSGRPPVTEGPTERRGPGVRVVAYVPDLMDRSKVRSAFPDVVLANRPADLAEATLRADAALVLVDLGRPGALAAVAALAGRSGARLVGFASHVDEPTLEAARRAGVEALARSVFFRRLPSLAGPAG